MDLWTHGQTLSLFQGIRNNWYGKGYEGYGKYDNVYWIGDNG